MPSLKEKLAAFDPELPLERARTIPANWYFDPEIAELERRTVFHDSWQVAGLVHQLEEKGSFVTAEIAGEPVLVVRGEDGRLRGFFNVCRHRAALVMNEPCGRASKLRCRYHGWTYDLTGRLRGVPEFDGVADFCREDNGLVPLPVDTWGPYVWVYLGESPSPLLDFLGPLIRRSGSRMERLHFVERREYDLGCNWKVFVDNYLDGGYHINTVHPGLANVIDYTKYHTIIENDLSVQVGPLTTPDGDDAVARVRSGDEAQYWWLFPNLMVNITGDVMDANIVFPLGPDRCRVIFDFYFADVTGDGAQQFIEESIAVSHQIQLEDMGICAEVQQGLRSQSYSTGRFSVKREGPGWHFHQLLGRRLVVAAQNR